MFSIADVSPKLCQRPSAMRGSFSPLRPLGTYVIAS